MTAKINQGDSPKKGPNSTRAWNRVVESSEDFHKRKGTSGGVRSLPGGSPVKLPKSAINYHTRIYAQNDTGVDLRLGEVVELEGYIPTANNNDTACFSGRTPDLTRIGWGIMLQPVAHESDTQSVGPCLLLGACVALVNVTDEDHEYANRVADSRVLVSAATGPVKILDKPSGTGELECWVQLQDEKGGDVVDIVQVYHSEELPGVAVEANEEGLHPGNIKRVIDEEMTDQGACWILFVDDYGNLAGNVPAVNSDYYGPGRLSGTFDVITEGEGEEPDTHDVRPLYVLRRGGAGVDMVRFQLLEVLSLTGHARGKLLKPAEDGSWEDFLTDPEDDETIVEIEVYDPYRPEGMWAGAVGYQGFAYPRGQQFTDEGEDEEDEEDDVERPGYDVVFLEQMAERIEGTLTERMGATTGGRASASVTYYDHQGKNPGSTVTVYDDQGVYPDAHSGAKFSAAYDYHAGYYRIERCQRIAQFARATITAHLCGGSSVSISSFSVLPCGEFVGSPGTTPTTAVISTVMGGRSGDKVLLRRISNDNPNPTWEVVQIDHHVVNLPWDVVVDGEGLKVVRRPFYVQWCDATETPDAEPFLETTPNCPPAE